jgi:hypothetical protein
VKTVGADAVRLDDGRNPRWVALLAVVLTLSAGFALSLVVPPARGPNGAAPTPVTRSGDSR